MLWSPGKKWEQVASGSALVDTAKNENENTTESLAQAVVSRAKLDDASASKIVLASIYEKKLLLFLLHPFAFVPDTEIFLMAEKEQNTYCPLKFVF